MIMCHAMLDYYVPLVMLVKFKIWVKYQSNGAVYIIVILQLETNSQCKYGFTVTL